MPALRDIRTEADVEAELLRLSNRKRAIDDELGRCSDHDGDDAGPTHHMFTHMRPEGYVQTVDYYIGRHEAAIRVCKRLISLKKRQLELAGKLPART